MSGNPFRKKMTKVMSEAADKLKTASSVILHRADYEKAIELAKHATEDDPNNSDVWIEYALALLLLSKRKEAWNAFQRGMDLSEGKFDSIKFNNSVQAIQFIRMHEDFGELQDAEEQFTSYADHNPMNPEGWCALGEFYIRQGRLTDASLLLINGLHELKHERIHLTLGKVHALQGSMKQALEQAILAVEMNPKFFEAVMHIALFSNRLDDNAREKKALKHAQKLKKKHPELQTKFDEMVVEIKEGKVSVLGQKEMEIKGTPKKKLEKKKPKPQTSLKQKAPLPRRPLDAVLPTSEMEMELVPTPDHEIIDDSEFDFLPIPNDEARPKGETVFQSESESEKSSESKMEKIHIIEKRPDSEAKSLPKKKPKAIPRTKTESEKKEEPTKSKKSSKKSKSALKKATVKNPDDPDVWYKLGEFLRTANDLLDSEMALKKAVMLDPLHSDALQSLGMCLLATNRIEESDIIFQRVAALDPSSSDSWIKLAQYQMEEDDLESADSSIRKALESNPENAEAWLVASLFKIKRGKIKDAEKHIRKAIAIDESYKEGWKTLGKILDMRGKKKGALEAFTKAANLDPSDSIAMSNVGVALGKNKKFQEALIAFQKAIEHDSENITAWRNISELYRMQGRIAESNEAGDRVFALERSKDNGN